MLEQEPLYKEFHRDEPWDSEHNKTLLAKMPDVLRGDAPTGSTFCRLQVFAGPATLFNDQKQRLRGNGFNTIFAVETPAELAVPWTKPADLAYVSDDPAKRVGENSRCWSSRTLFRRHDETPACHTDSRGVAGFNRCQESSQGFNGTRLTRRLPGLAG